MNTSVIDRTVPETRQRVDARRLAVAASGAIIVNLVVFGIGSAVGVDWQANGQPIAWFMVVPAVVVPMALGGAVTALLARRWGSATRVMAWVGLALALVSLGAPFSSAATVGTAVFLATMHLVTGLAWFAAVLPRGRA